MQISFPSHTKETGSSITWVLPAHEVGKQLQMLQISIDCCIAISFMSPMQGFRLHWNWYSQTVPIGYHELSETT